MSRRRLNIFLEPAHASRLDALAAAKAISKSSIIAAALSAYLSAEGPNDRIAGVGRRLDALSRQFDHLERDQTILVETLALWIRHQLSATTPIPEGLQDAARAQGRARFADFVTQLARHLQRGGSLVRTVWQEITPEETSHPSTPASGQGHAGERVPRGALTEGNIA